MRHGIALLAALGALLWPGLATAQFPAELSGRVVEQGTSRAIDGAVVEVGSARAVTDAAGAFVVRVPEVGDVDVTVSHPAYAELRLSLRLESGRTTSELFALEPVPWVIEGIEVVAAREPGHVIAADEIERSGARNLAELLRNVPGVVVRESSTGGARVSIRGSAADQVLVMVDGAPVNDPITGEADAGAVALQNVRSVRILVGAQSARYGARAAAGVIVVESDRAPAPFAAASVETGSLGARALEAEAGTNARGGAAASAGIRYRGSDGDFSYDRPSALGGGSAQRRNGDEREIGGFASVVLPLLGELHARVDLADIERGLPGPMHAPSPQARQHVVRRDVRATWDATTSLATLRARATAGWRRFRFDDPAPAFGPPYHDTTHVLDGALRLEAERASGSRFARTFALGAEARRSRLRSTTLEPSSISGFDPSLFARAVVELPAHRLAPRVSVAARGDRWQDDWILSHDVAFSATAASVTASLAHRSAFSPPAAGDQFFAAGFSIAPNPALEPERIRSEVELTVTAARAPRGIPLELGASAFRSDMDGMIVWAPDFRFVWSPRNRDVKRSGGEAWLRMRPAHGVELGAWGALARVTYDWAGDTDTVQVVYRPRYSGGFSADWRRADWSFALDGVYTGLRYATPGHANSLPGYWDVRLALGRSWQRGPLAIDAALRIDRLFDNTDAFVHGYAEPGRRISIEVRLRTEEDDYDIAINRTDS